MGHREPAAGLIAETISQQEATSASNEFSGEIEKEEVVEAISSLR